MKEMKSNVYDLGDIKIKIETKYIKNILLYIIVVYISILPGHTCIVVNNPCGLVFA
jgi:hypothetical protein